MTISHHPIDLHSDGHVHTRLCRHAIGEMEEYVLAAIERGLSEIVFLEHLEIGISYHDRTWLTDEEFDFYTTEGQRLQHRYGERIRIGIGIELGYNLEQEAELRRRATERSWDRIGISCHFLPIEANGGHLNLLSRRRENIDLALKLGTDQLLTAYFERLLAAVENLPGTVLCHLDAALRHVPGISLSPSHFEQVEALLAAVKRQKMRIEVNTSGFAMRNAPFPARELLAMAIDRDIPLVAGSDAHRPEDVGRFFEKLPAYLTSVRCP